MFYEFTFLIKTCFNVFQNSENCDNYTRWTGCSAPATSYFTTTRRGRSLVPSSTRTSARGWWPSYRGICPWRWTSGRRGGASSRQSTTSASWRRSTTVYTDPSADPRWWSSPISTRYWCPDLTGTGARCSMPSVGATCPRQTHSSPASTSSVAPSSALIGPATNRCV